MTNRGRKIQRAGLTFTILAAILAGYASVIDRTTGDPTYIQAQ